MKPEAFQTYVNKLYDEFGRLFKHAAATAEVEAIHDIRVQIKKINCLYIFLDETRLLRVKQDGYYPQMKSFFKVAGKLRDLQLHRSLIRKYSKKQQNDFAEYDNYVKGLEDHAKVNFFRNTVKYPEDEQKNITGRIEKVIKSQDQKSLNTLAQNFINRRIRRIESYYFNQDSDKLLHKARQTLKELRYFLEMYVYCFPADEAPKIDFTDIKKIEEILGGWNDKQIFLDDLNRFIKYYYKLNPKTSSNGYQKLANQIEKDMEKDIKDIYPRLLRLISNIMLVLLKIK